MQSPDTQAVANALDLQSSVMTADVFGDSETGIEALADLDGDGVPELAVKWRPSPASAGVLPNPASPSLFVLSWNGKAWQASYLVTGTYAASLQAMPDGDSGAAIIAVTTINGATETPYPVLFRFRGHQALLLWDGRSDSSEYTGYDYGSIQFEKNKDGSMPEMIVSGRADPGLLSVPKDPENHDRGFQVTSLYAWKNGAYVPVHTEYSPSPDYTIYRFIAALHLHDFQAAYALIAPQQFLKSNKPSLKVFQEQIQKQWPEFLDDRIFSVPSHSMDDPGGHTFILKLEDGLTNVYHPTLGATPPYLLTGLERTQSRD